MWITRVSINNPVFATMVMVALCVLGVFSYVRLGVEQLPDVTPPIAFIQVEYPGASPEAVEREVTKLVEEAVNSIAGVKRITSRSFEGRSQTQIEFTLNADMARAMQDVRDRLAVVQASFPEDAKAPLINRFDNENSQPVVTLALVSKTRSERELSIIGEQTVGKRLQRVEGVAQVDISGLSVREVRIDLDPLRLRAYGVTPAQVASALGEANADQPVGLISNAVQDSILRVEGRVRDPRQFENVVVAHRNGLPLTLGDLGTLVEREREPDSMARMNGQPSINFDIFKQQDANIVATGEAIKAVVEEVRKSLPPDVELILVNANSDYVKDSLNGLLHTLIEGALLTVAIVFLFLHSWRSTVITGLTLPIAVISSFIAVYAFGFTLNFMTMMALSLCIGLLIDDAIVVRENIVRHVHMGKDHFKAALEGGDGHHLRDLRGVRAGGLHGRHRRQVLLRLRHHRRGGGAGEPVRQLHARPDVVQPLEGPAVDAPAGRAGARQPDARHRPGARRAAPRLRTADPLGLQRRPLPAAAAAGIRPAFRRRRPAPA
jgi:multidrug efflux pump subunit AcrB